MFDGLKEKLGQFREDATEAADAADAPADAEAPDEPAAEEGEDDPSFTDPAKSLATGKVILDAADLEAFVVERMAGAMELRVPLEVGSARSERWIDAK